MMEIQFKLKIGDCLTYPTSLKNKKANYIHFKIKASGKIVKELEKNESIDQNLLRYMTVKVKKFDLETNYFSKKDEIGKKEDNKN